MHQSVAIGLASILVLGISAQWFAWRFKIPSILLLLVFGFIARSVSGFTHPDELFGELLFPLVSLSVAIILFEGGLSLKLNELAGVGDVVRRLISWGVLVSWVVTALAAFSPISPGLSGPFRHNANLRPKGARAGSWCGARCAC